MNKDMWREIITAISSEDENIVITFKVHEHKDPDNFLHILLKDKLNDDRLSMTPSKSLAFKIYESLGQELFEVNIGKGAL